MSTMTVEVACEFNGRPRQTLGWMTHLRPSQGPLQRPAETALLLLHAANPLGRAVGRASPSLRKLSESAAKALDLIDP